MNLLKGKVAIVTGAGGGLGRAHALALAAEGAKVVVNDLGSALDGTGGATSMADQVVEEIKAAGGEAVANYDTVATMAGGTAIVETAVNAFGRLDILVNNAGILRDKTILKMDEPQWDIVMAVHLKGTFAVTQPALRQMVEQDQSGRVVNTSSTSGLLGSFGQANYGAAKAGIAGFTRVAALEMQKHNITVNAIVPLAKTRMTTDIANVPADFMPEQISPMVVFLCSDLAKDITGRVFAAFGPALREFKYVITPGVEKKNGLWTPQEIAERFADITRETSSVAEDKHHPELCKLFEETLPSLFRPDAAPGWNAVIHFKFAGAEPYTYTIQDGKLGVRKGLQGKATSVVETDATTALALFTGRLDPMQAFMAGKLNVSNQNDMMKFPRAFPSPKKK